MRRGPAHLAGLCAALCACGGASQLEPLGLSRVETPFAVAAPEAPAAPAGPRFLPCPAGWVERGSAPVACSPWLNDLPEACGVGMAHFVGAPHCSTVGAACPAGEFSEALPTGRPVLYVSATAATAGDGTRAAPFATVRAAFAAAGPGTVVALGKGSHPVEDLVPAGLSLVGACAAQTTVTRAPTSPRMVELYVKAAGVEVRDLRVSGAGVGLQVEGDLATASVSGVVFEGVGGYGVSAVRNGHVTLHEVVIRNTGAVGAVAGRGVELALGGTLDADRLVIDGSPEVGVHVAGAGSRATLSDTAITRSGGASASTGFGLRVEAGARAQLTRVFVGGSQNEGVSAISGATIVLTDVVVRDTAPVLGTGRFGDGIAAHGSTVTGTRVRLELNTHSGAVASDQSTLSLEDLLVADTRVDQLNLGLGVLSNLGSHVTVTRGFLRSSTALGAGASDPGTTLTLSDVQVEDTRVSAANASAGLGGGGGVGVRLGAHVTLTRVAIRAAHSYGVEVAGPVSRLDATDLDIADTLEGFDFAGVGLGAFDAVVNVDRLAIHRSVSVGLHLQEPGTRAVVNDVLVEGTLADSRGEGGASAVATLGATLSGARLTLLNARVTGLLVNSAGTSASLVEVLVAGTRLPCATTTCVGTLAQGVAALESAAVQLSRFRVSDNEGIGVLQATGGQVSLSHGEIAFHLIGAVALDSQFDTAKLADDVAYAHNQRRLSAESVPLPKVPVFAP